jgi:hypothetical protein
MTLKRAPIAGAFALALVSPEPGAATTLYLEATGGLHRPFDQDPWGGRAATLFDHRAEHFVAFAVAALSLGYASVEARGHLGTDRVTDMNLAAAVTAGGGLMLGTFGLGNRFEVFDD